MYVQIYDVPRHISYMCYYRRIGDARFGQLSFKPIKFIIFAVFIFQRETRWAYHLSFGRIGGQNKKIPATSPQNAITELIGADFLENSPISF